MIHSNSTPKCNAGSLWPLPVAEADPLAELPWPEVSAITEVAASAVAVACSFGRQHDKWRLERAPRQPICSRNSNHFSFHFCNYDPWRHTVAMDFAAASAWAEASPPPHTLATAWAVAFAVASAAFELLCAVAVELADAVAASERPEWETLCEEWSNKVSLASPEVMSLRPRCVVVSCSTISLAQCRPFNNLKSIP